jgi:hypothetical protein
MAEILGFCRIDALQSFQAIDKKRQKRNPTHFCGPWAVNRLYFGLMT